jgi:hypothetical protein
LGQEALLLGVDPFLLVVLKVFVGVYCAVNQYIIMPAGLHMNVRPRRVF